MLFLCLSFCVLSHDSHKSMGNARLFQMHTFFLRKNTGGTVPI